MEDILHGSHFKQQDGETNRIGNGDAQTADVKDQADIRKKLADGEKSQADSADSLMTDLKVQKAFVFVKENAEITEVVETDGQ